MRRQRNMAQMKEQIKTPEKELNKIEISNLLGAEFKTLAIRMLKEISEDLSSIKKTQSETKDTLIEIKNNLQGNNRRVDEAKNQINNLEDKEEITTNQKNKNKKSIQKKKPNSVSSLWDNFKRSNIPLIGVLEGEEEEQEIGNLFEKILKLNFLNLVKGIDMQVQEAQRVPNKMDAKRPTPKYIIIKMSRVNNKERILKAARENK